MKTSTDLTVLERPPLEVGPKIVWEPLRGSQTLAQSCPANIIIHHGTRGPGKTDGQLMRFRRRVGQGYGRHWRGAIFDREYKNLDDLVSKSLRWFPEFDDGARFISSKSDYKWVWKTGEELFFRAIKRESDYWGYHGQEFPFIGWNELTKYPNDTLFDMMMSCNRSSFLPEDHPLIIDGDLYNKTGELKFVRRSSPRAMMYKIPEIPLEVFITTNPYGVGHNWVKKRFISNAPMGKIVRRSVNVFNPRTQKREDVVKTQVHIFGSYRENKYLNPEYIVELESITDPNRRKAWLGGSWDIVAGGMFDDVWSSPHHVLEPFPIPHNWRIDRSFDWGSSHPFSVGWWAESDGSDVKLANGKWRSTVKGDLFRIGEWYGWTGKSNQGLHLLDEEISAGIVERELAWGLYGRVHPGPADTSIWTVENGNSTAARMSARVRLKSDGKVYKGINWIRSNKNPGSRKVGWLRCRDMLKHALPAYVMGKDNMPINVPRERPGMYAFNTCVMFIDLFPSLPRDEKDMDDVDTESEDHIGDETRYEVLSKLERAKSGTTQGT